ncbi:unnamed protein product [Mytilus coruscus]|uniref:Uncharacterized protein n=1 Tax=Mytilus coruscus TaxID=42192 RepID=A0A6J8AJM5_MYTCO|nr:unnamed protein product [Mytilus coruscus]
MSTDGLVSLDSNTTLTIQYDVHRGTSLNICTILSILYHVNRGTSLNICTILSILYDVHRGTSLNRDQSEYLYHPGYPISCPQRDQSEYLNHPGYPISCPQRDQSEYLYHPGYPISCPQRDQSEYLYHPEKIKRKSSPTIRRIKDYLYNIQSCDSTIQKPLQESRNNDKDKRISDNKIQNLSRLGKDKGEYLDNIIHPKTFPRTGRISRQHNTEPFQGLGEYLDNKIQNLSKDWENI